MKSKYAMTEHQIEQFSRDLAAAQGAVSNGRTTYLRVLVTGIQAILGNIKRGKSLAVETQLTVVEDVGGKYYAAVLRGIDAEGIEALERNRLTTFARVAKSVLTSWVKAAGGDIRTLNAETVTRDPLLKAVREARGTSEPGYAMQRHVNAMVRLATTSGDRGALEEAIQALSDALDEMANGNKTDEVGSITHVLASRPAHTRQPRTSARQ